MTWSGQKLLQHITINLLYSVGGVSRSSGRKTRCSRCRCCWAGFCYCHYDDDHDDLEGDGDNGENGDDDPGEDDSEENEMIMIAMDGDGGGDVMVMVTMMIIVKMIQRRMRWWWHLLTRELLSVETARNSQPGNDFRFFIWSALDSSSLWCICIWEVCFVWYFDS